MLEQMGYMKHFSVGIYKSYLFISCSSCYTFLFLSKRFYGTSELFIWTYESVKYFDKKLMQVGKCIITISIEVLQIQYKHFSKLSKFLIS